MSDVTRRIAELSPEKRALLTRKLTRGNGSGARAASIPRRPEREFAPLSFAQERLWFLDQLEPGSSVYNMPISVRLSGALDVTALVQSLNEVVRRHEVLRARFVTVDGAPVQVIAPVVTIDPEQVDLTDLPESEREGHARSLIFEEGRRPFNLSTGPLVRAVLLRLAGTEHVLIVTLHHIVADGWSIGVLLREVGEIYTALRGAQSPCLPELPIQYADFACWQRERLEGEVLELQLAYWKEQLGGVIPVLDLPADRPRPPVQSYRGAHEVVVLPVSLTEALVELGRREGVTLFMLLLAAFQTLLHRYTGQEEIHVGTPVAGRLRPELEALIGFFINTLVMRAELSDDPTFRELLRRTRAVALGAYEHQELPFERLVEALQPERDLRHTPLFQALFVLQNQPEQRLELPGLTLSLMEVETGTVKCDLTLSMEERGRNLVGLVGYNTDLFDPGTIRRMFQQFEVLLAGIVADPEQRLSELPLLKEEERRQIVVEWNRTQRDLPVDRRVHQLFEAQVARRPDAVAVSCEGGRLTYGELNRRANQLAHHLAARGVGRETIVALCVERSPEMIVGLLGILKAGGAYLPLDPAEPAERLAWMLEDSGACLLLTQSSLRERLGDPRPPMLCLDADWPAVARESEANPVAVAAPEDLAYVIYTSGSTGRPKGVLIEHRSLSNYVLAAGKEFALTPADRVLQFASISFDAAAEEIYPCLAHGASLVLRSDAALVSAPAFLQSCLDQGITVLDLPTAYWHQLTQEIAAEGLAAPPSLRLVIIGGERALPERLAQWQERVGDRVRLLNTYGPTEATIVATVWDAGEGIRGECRAVSRLREVPIGGPVANVQTYVLDRNLRPVPVGVPGELCIGGAGVARGYLNRPDLTADRFLPDPFRSGGRLYRTGDRVRYLADGNLEFLGRIDQQVKVRGYRIEPGEVEGCLRRHPGLRGAAVVAREDRPGDRRLVAYLVPDARPAPTTAELRAFLAARLPPFMIPSLFVELDALPLTAGGKVNYRALPPPDPARPELGRDLVPPRTPLEAALAEMWQELLGVERVGVRDSFFELGGDSLRAAVFVNRLQKALGEVVYVVLLFDAPTIAELAVILEREYAASVARWLAAASPSAHPDGLGGSGAAVGAMLGEGAPVIEPATLAQMRRLVAARGPSPGEEERFLRSIRVKNPPAVFILSAPRSGTTLLRVMLAGHPRLFSPPELALLGYQTLRERNAAFAGRDHGWLEGVLRALMEIHGWDLDEARRRMAEYEAWDLTTHRFYGLLQEWIGERTLVDKTTTYAMSLQTLQRAEVYFENARYIHLVRRPAAMIQSYLESKLDQVFGHGYPFPVREKAELIWLLSNENICRFFEEIPDDRRITVRFEDLLERPRECLEQICRFLDLSFDPEMLEPYRGRKMTDGVHPESPMVGDPRFHEHHGIDPEVARKWSALPAGEPVSPLTQELAGRLGYEGRTESPAAGRLGGLGPVERGRELPLSFAQQRLWFLDQLEPGSAVYNIPAAVRLRGRLDVAALARGLNEIVRRHEALRTTFPSVDGRAVQAIHPELCLPLPVVDLRRLPEGEREAEVARRAGEEARRPFDLARGPLLRACLLRLDEQEHVVLVTLHHIVADGWSLGVLVRELAALYAAFSSGEPSPLPELPIQYADFAVWQRNGLQGEVLERQLAYWKQALSGSPPLLELPTDRPRPAVQSYRGAQQSFVVPAELTRALKELSRREGATLFMTLMAAFQTLLCRYSGQSDISVGTPVMGRGRAELEPLIGFFANTLVVRADLSGDPSFQEVLARVRRAVVGALAHQDLPFEMLVDALQPARVLSHPPLFQVMFALQEMAIEALQVPGVTLTPMIVEGGVAKFDLTLSMSVGKDGLTGILEYNTDLFEASTIEQMARHFHTLLDALLHQPLAPLSSLPLLLPDERDALLRRCHPRASFPSHFCLHHRFQEIVRRFPHAPALSFEGQHLSYDLLNRRANQLAHLLLQHDVRPDTLVGICLDRSFDLIVALLAVLKAGAAYLPLDPSYPQQRLAFMLDDAQVPLVLTHAALRDRLPHDGSPTAPRLLCLDADAPAIAQQPDRDPVTCVTPDHLAYCIYTSGSTGRPKGVLVSHRNVARLFTATDPWFGFDERQVWTLFHSIAFDFSVWEVWGALLYGGRLVVAPYLVSRSPEAFYGLLEQEQVTVLNQTPSAFGGLAEVAGRRGVGRLSLRWVIFGGEALEEERLVGWWAVQGAGGPRLVNMYGITETTVHVTCREVRAGEGGVGSGIGEAIPDLGVYVLDERGEPAPVGVWGELYVGGAGVARGYLNRPELTGERFVANRFGEGVLYRTGDRGRYRWDGKLEYGGRVDEQVKVRGFRIEPGEIAAALVGEEGVREAAVVAREEAGGEKRLVAYVVGSEEGAASGSELRRRLKEKLPEYLVPAAIVFVEALPLTANGKLDRKALPAPESARPELETPYRPPTSPAEVTLASIWGEVLGLERVGVEDNFFELGGDSILSIQVIARANQAGLGLTPRQLFEHPTIAGLASVANRDAPVEAEQGLVTGPAPLTPIQRWFFEQEPPDPHHWNQALLLEIDRQIDPARLEEAVAALLVHHDALRLRFRRAPHGWEAENAGLWAGAALERIDLSGVGSAQQAAAIEAAAEGVQRSLELGSGRLLRAAWMDLGAGRGARLLLVCHHLAIDAVSWRILLEDLQRLIGLEAEGGTVELPAKTTSYQEWARRLEAYARSGEAEAERGYWEEVVRGSEGWQVPVAEPAGENGEAWGERVVVGLEAEETKALVRGVRAGSGAGVQEALLWALGEVLGEWTGAERVWVEVEGHGREERFEGVDVTRTVGWFTTIYPVRLEVGGGGRVEERLERVKEQVRGVPGGGLGYGVLRYLGGEGGVGGLERWRGSGVCLNYLGQVAGREGGGVLRGAKEGVGRSRSEGGERRHEVSVTGVIVEGRLKVEWGYSERRQRREEMEGLAEAYVRKLRELIAASGGGGEEEQEEGTEFAEVRLSPSELETLVNEVS